jgi:hypothetical protein
MPKPKCALVAVKLHGLGFNTRPKNTDFYLIFEILQPKVISYWSQVTLS